MTTPRRFEIEERVQLDGTIAGLPVGVAGDVASEPLRSVLLGAAALIGPSLDRGGGMTLPEIVTWMREMIDGVHDRGLLIEDVEEAGAVKLTRDGCTISLPHSRPVRVEPEIMFAMLAFWSDARSSAEKAIDGMGGISSRHDVTSTTPRELRNET
jgi:hypothetical protein